MVWGLIYQPWNMIIGLLLFSMPTWILASPDERAHAWDLTATVSLNKQTDYLSLGACVVVVAATCLLCIFNSAAHHWFDSHPTGGALVLAPLFALMTVRDWNRRRRAADSFP
jgi:hypothetical protein